MKTKYFQSKWIRAYIYIISFQLGSRLLKIDNFLKNKFSYPTLRTSTFKGASDKEPYD